MTRKPVCTMVRLLAAFARSQAGAVAVEYVVLVSGIGVVVLASIFLLGEDLSGYWTDLNASIGSAGGQ